MELLIKSMPVGLIMIIFILWNLLKIKHKTLSLIIVESLLFVPLLLICGPLSIIYIIITCILFVFLKIKIFTDVVYDESFRSVSYYKNKFLQKKTGPGFKSVGKVIPFNDKTVQYNNKLIQVSDTIACGGTLITGSTGSGKTYTMKSMIYQDLMNGHSVTFFDYKGEVKLMDEFREFCESHNIEFYEFSAQNIDFMYDPLIELNETGKIEAILNTRKWSMDGSDAHYRTATQLFIQKIVQAYDQFRRQNNITDNYVNGLYTFSKTFMYNQNERDGYLTVNKMLELLLTSNARKLFGLEGEKKEFSFNKEEQYMVCFSFMSSNKELANSISSFVMKDLLDRGTRKEFVPGMALYIDEFGTLENSMIIKDILEKGRSGGVQTTFSILDINQISLTTSPHFLQAILGTINSFIIHAGATKQTAEVLSGVQIYQMDYGIMSLKKPYKGKPPTAIFISKYPIFDKNGEIGGYKIQPFIYKDKNKPNFMEQLKENLNDIKNSDNSEKSSNSKESEVVILDNDYIDNNDSINIENENNGDHFNSSINMNDLNSEERKELEQATKENNNKIDFNDFL